MAELNSSVRSRFCDLFSRTSKSVDFAKLFRVELSNILCLVLSRCSRLCWLVRICVDCQKFSALDFSRQFSFRVVARIPIESSVFTLEINYSMWQSNSSDSESCGDNKFSHRHWERALPHFDNENVRIKTNGIDKSLCRRAISNHKNRERRKTS